MIINLIIMADEDDIVVFCFHGVPDDIAHSWVNTKPEVFAAYMEFLKKNNYGVIAMKDLKLKNLKWLCFKRILFDG